MAEKVWLITGVSGGLGRALAIEAANKGDIVIGTVRKPEQLDEFRNLIPGKTFSVKLDVTQHFQTKAVIDPVIEKFGRVDVLVNNAGYGLLGAIEEVNTREVREQFETNVFGALTVTQAVLPFMRKQKSGHIVQMSSAAGFRSSPGLGIYNASKFALEGLSEALAYEVAPLGIKVTIVEPGPFRTQFAGTSSIRAAATIKDYESTAWLRIKTIHQYNGKQLGDPKKAALAIIKAVESENPPLRLALGQYAVDAIKAKIESVVNDLTAWEDVGLNTNFD